MFETLPAAFRAKGLTADVRTLLLLQKAMSKDLVKTLGDLYVVLRGIVVTDPKMLGPYTKAYYQYFLSIDIQNGERLDDAVLRSETFGNWKIDFFSRHPDAENMSTEELVSKFLDEVHLTSYDIKKVLSGKEIWDKDNPHLEDEDGEGGDMSEGKRRELDRMADYSDLSLEELLERMRQVMEQQKGKHSGGSHWVGTGGISPYGHGGAAMGGVRVGGTGGGKMARRVLGDKNFFPVDMDKIINDDNVDAALASLKGITEASAQDRLDVEGTIKEGLRRGGLFIPEIESVEQEKLQILLFIDNGGYSMSPYVFLVRELFKKMKTRFAHDLETYYFHNTIYDRVFSDDRRSKPVFIDKILAKNPDYRIFIIGDAAMAPYELNKLSLRTYKKLKDKFKRVAWLNPEPERYWIHTFSINIINKMLDMYPLTPRGIENAVRDMNRKK